jgi:hypothetical protein
VKGKGKRKSVVRFTFKDDKAVRFTPADDTVATMPMPALLQTQQRQYHAMANSDDPILRERGRALLAEAAELQAADLQRSLSLDAKNRDRAQKADGAVLDKFSLWRQHRPADETLELAVKRFGGTLPERARKRLGALHRAGRIAKKITGTGFGPY